MIWGVFPPIFGSTPMCDIGVCFESLFFGGKILNSETLAYRGYEWTLSFTTRMTAYIFSLRDPNCLHECHDCQLGGGGFCILTF